MLTNTGLMRVLVHLLSQQPEKKLVVSEAVVEKQFVENIAIFHDPATKTFKLQLLPSRPALSRDEQRSLIITPNPN